MRMGGGSGGGGAFVVVVAEHGRGPRRCRSAPERSAARDGATIGFLLPRRAARRPSASFRSTRLRQPREGERLCHVSTARPPAVAPGPRDEPARSRERFALRAPESVPGGGSPGFHSFGPRRGGSAAVGLGRAPRRFLVARFVSRASSFARNGGGSGERGGALPLAEGPVRGQSVRRCGRPARASIFFRASASASRVRTRRALFSHRRLNSRRS